MRLATNCLWLTLTVMTIVLFGPTARADTRAARLEGIRLYEAGRFAEAIPYFDQVLARKSRDVEILNKRGACYLRTNQPARALADFDRVNRHAAWFSSTFGAGAIQLPQSTWMPQPSAWITFPESWGNRGIALLMLGRNEEALESFRVATNLWNLSENRWGRLSASGQAQLIRGRGAAYQGLGQAYYRAGQRDMAVQAYSEAIAIYPSDPNAFAGRADVLAALKLTQDALADYSEAIRLDPAHSRALAGRGILYSDLGRDDQAISDLSRAIEVDPEFARAYSHRGGIYARRGENAAALADYNTLLRLVPDDAGAHKDRGGILVRMGRFDEAIRELDEAIRLDPARATAFQNRGAAYNGLGQYERAIRDLDEAIRLDPDNAGAHTNRGLARFAIGDYDESLADLSASIKLAPNNAVPCFNRAQVFERLGVADRAVADYEQAIQLDPRFAVARNALDKLRADIARNPTNGQRLDMALQTPPSQTNEHFERANSLRERGDWRGAIGEYDQAIMLEPKRAELYIVRGWARLCMGVEGADYDARAFLALKGWRGGMAPYMAVLGGLGARAASRPADGERLLDEALVNLPRGNWPVPILRYLKGDLSERQLLDLASNDKQKNEAHAFVGVDRVLLGDQEKGSAHLRWASEHARPGSIAGDVARAFLSRSGGDRPEGALKSSAGTKEWQERSRRFTKEPAD
jgi:tetratricopeptide (TPR) repeat protein